MQSFDLTLTLAGNARGLESVRAWLSRFDSVSLSSDFSFVTIPAIATVLVNDDGRDIRLHIVADDIESARRIRSWIASRIDAVTASCRGRSVDAVWQRPWLVAAQVSSAAQSFAA